MSSSLCIPLVSITFISPLLYFAPYVQSAALTSAGAPSAALPKDRTPAYHTISIACAAERGAVETKNRGAGRGRQTEGETERGGTEWRKSDREPDRTIVKSGHRDS